MADFTLTQAGAELQNLINKIDPTEKKLTKLSWEIGNYEGLYNGIISESIDIKAGNAITSKVGRSYNLKKGKTYNIVISIDTAIQKSISNRLLKVDDTNTALANFGITAGQTTNEINYTPNEDVEVFIGCYCGVDVELQVKVSGFDGILDDIEKNAIALESIQKDIDGEKHENTYTLNVLPAYARIPLEKSIEKGHIITFLDASEANNSQVWLGNTSAELNLSAETLPYITTKSYNAVFANANGVVVIKVSDGLPNVDGLKDKVYNLEKSVYGESNTFTIEPTTTQGYARVALDSPINIGYEIKDVTADGQVWLGNNEAELRIDNLAFPYKVTKKYTAIFGSVTGVAKVTYNNGKADVMGLTDAILTRRQQIFISQSDSQIDIYNKFKLAMDTQNCDVIFEKGGYVLDNTFYDWISAFEGWRKGLPIGNGCRYYGNSAIIRSYGRDAETDTRFIFDAKDSNFELYDFTLELNDNGTYCVHDEGNGSRVPYFHKYKNIIFKSDGRVCIGSGTGYDSVIDIEDCMFYALADKTGNLNMHGPTNNEQGEKVNVVVHIKGCYYLKGFPIYMDVRTFDKTRDNVQLVIANNAYTGTISPDTENSVTDMLIY